MRIGDYVPRRTTQLDKITKFLPSSHGHERTDLPIASHSNERTTCMRHSPESRNSCCHCKGRIDPRKRVNRSDADILYR
eukprot:CCRYP_001515-RA/>CCRYP_001515-RA protein AED:0.04 eAED:0.04 QI:647/1/1/1/0/0/3/1135/78